jgi:hypothetical protein
MRKVMEILVGIQCACGRLRDRRGQNTVEYLLMLTVLVGVVMGSCRSPKGRATTRRSPALRRAVAFPRGHH